jgi:hypothetical protein
VPPRWVSALTLAARNLPGASTGMVRPLGRGRCSIPGPVARVHRSEGKSVRTSTMSYCWPPEPPTARGAGRRVVLEAGSPQDLLQLGELSRARRLHHDVDVLRLPQILVVNVERHRGRADEDHGELHDLELLRRAVESLEELFSPHEACPCRRRSATQAAS